MKLNFSYLGVTVIGVLAIGYIVDYILYFYYLKNWEKRTSGLWTYRSRLILQQAKEKESSFLHCYSVHHRFHHYKR